MMWDKIDEKPIDEEKLRVRVAEAVAEVVAKQREVGVDIISDGEMGKVGFSNYIMDRFSGFAAQAETWSLIFWGKNITDKKYNTEFSPGGFVFKAQPARWGVNATKRF